MGLEILEGPFGWVPKVEKCCWSINLKVGTIIIAIISAIYGVSSGIFWWDSNYCLQFRSKSLFTVVHWMDVFCSIFIFALAICAIIMLITILVDSLNVWVKPYIVCWIGMIVCALLSLFFAFIVFLSIDSSVRCYTAKSGISSAVLEHLALALIGLYFCMVVNSYAASDFGGGSSRSESLPED